MTSCPPSLVQDTSLLYTSILREKLATFERSLAVTPSTVSIFEGIRYVPTFLKDEQSCDFIPYGHLIKSLSKEDLTQIDNRLEQEWKELRANTADFQREFLLTEPGEKFVASKYIQYVKEQSKKTCHKESFTAAVTTTTSATITSPLRALRPAQNALASSRSTSPVRAVRPPQNASASPRSASSVRVLRPAQNTSPSARSAPSRQSSDPDAAIENMLAGNFSAPRVIQICDLMGNAAILASGKIGQLCKYEALVMEYDSHLRDIGKEKSVESSPAKKSRTAEPPVKKCLDVVCVDRTGPLSGTLYTPVAELFLNSIHRFPTNRVMKLDKVRISGFSKNDRNGECLTRCRRFESVGPSGSMPASKITITSAGTSHAMLRAKFVPPDEECCVSVFAEYQERLVPPFRVTLRGIIGDLQPTAPSRSGNDKRVFRLYDSQGDFIVCCAQGNLCHNDVLVDDNEIIIFFAAGRDPIGSDEGMVCALKDSCILPVGFPSHIPAERNQIHIGVNE